MLKSLIWKSNEKSSKKKILLLRILLVSLTFAFYFMLSPHICAAVDYYVSTTGNDVNSGTISQPWRNIQKAADFMSAGDTVIVNAGNYGGDVSVFKKVRITRSGSSGLPITYQASGVVLTQGFLVSADYITIKGFDVEDPHDGRVKTSTEPDYRGGTGFFVEGSNNIIENNYIHGCVKGGITLGKNNNFLLPANTIIRNNRLFRNAQEGISVAGRNNLIEDNEIWATIQHHPGNIQNTTATWLDADGMRFFGQGHIIRKNYIHDIKYGAPGVNLDPNDPNNIYNLNNDLISNAHIDCFQTWNDQYHETAQNVIFEQNYCDNLQSQASNENGHGFMISGGANNLTIKNNIIRAYLGVNTGGTGHAHHLYIYNNLWVNNLAFNQWWPGAVGLEDAPYSIVKNNIFYDQPYHTLSNSGDVTGDEISNNLAYNSNGTSADCFRIQWVCQPTPPGSLWSVNPKFVNPVNKDYHLQAGSPAIDAGIAITGVTNDYSGVVRPQGVGFDIGPYEQGSIVPSPTPVPSLTPIPTSTALQNYYVSTTGNDTNPGTIGQPWLTIQKAVQTVVAGDTIYVRGGEYNGIANGWIFKNSGTQSRPITFSNYSGEQVVLKFIAADRNDRNIFGCSAYVKDHPDWQTPKADYIHIIGTDVTPHLLSNGVESKKGIVMQGMVGEQSSAIIARDCDYWEVAGVDFIDVSSGIFTFKDNWGTMVEHSTDHWYVHDNRVYAFYRESGMQFNGDENRIENNEVYKVTNRVDTPFGCQHFNFLGDHNIIKGNNLSRLGSTADCVGIVFEWDLSDMNTVEQNRISDVNRGIDIEGGDNNIIRNNIIYQTGTPNPWAGGIEIKSYDNSIKTDWPCNEALGGAESAVILPANNPAHPDYQYYYNPRNCHSYGNQIYNNTVHGFVEGIRLYLLAGENTIIRNNVFSGWTRGGVCFYKASDGTCKPLPIEVTVDHNADQGNFGFVNLAGYDFHLQSGSKLIGAGVTLTGVTNDFDGISRPQGSGYDIGAYEYVSSPITPTPALIFKTAWNKILGLAINQYVFPSNCHTFAEKMNKWYGYVWGYNILSGRGTETSVFCSNFL